MSRVMNFQKFLSHSCFRIKLTPSSPSSASPCPSLLRSSSLSRSSSSPAIVRQAFGLPPLSGPVGLSSARRTLSRRELLSSRLLLAGIYVTLGDCAALLGAEEDMLATTCVQELEDGTR